MISYSANKKNNPPKPDCNNNKTYTGFTLIELLIAVFVVGTAMVGVFGLFVLSLRLAQESERRLVAIALANERMEMVRNLPYVDVGTEGGIPPGAIPQEEEVTRNGVPYTVNTDIRFIDDPYDGTGEEIDEEGCIDIAHFPPGNPNNCSNMCVGASALRAHMEHGDYVGTCEGGESGPDVLNTDYKQVRVEVSWPSPNEPKPLLLITKIAPEGVEGGDLYGTLDLSIINSQGTGVAGVDVNLINDTVDPVINISTQTDSGGNLVLPGLPEASSSYELSVSKTSYTGEQTYDATADFIPDADHGHLSMLVGEATEKTFMIDLAGQLNLSFEEGGDNIDNYCEGEPPGQIAGQEYTLKGSKTIGADGDGDPVYMIDLNDVTDTNGEASHEELVWDSYSLSLPDITACDIKETSEILPLTINPGESKEMQVKLVKHTPISLHVYVVDSDNAPVNNATVTLKDNGVEETLGTGEWGQVFFADLPVDADYTIEADAAGYNLENQRVTVEENSRTKIELIAE